MTCPTVLAGLSVQETTNNSAASSLSIILVSITLPRRIPVKQLITQQEIQILKSKKSASVRRRQCPALKLQVLPANKHKSEVSTDTCYELGRHIGKPATHIRSGCCT